MADRNLTLARLHEVLHYDPGTGAFTWLQKRGRQAAGSRAGTVANKKRGTIQIRVDGAFYLAHRLAWFYVKGRWPEREIDHRDTNAGNNAWKNLRDVTPAVNSQNALHARPHSKSGILGVSPKHGRPGKFIAQIMVDGKAVHLGTFDDPEIGGAVYADAKFQLHHESTFAQE